MRTLIERRKPIPAFFPFKQVKRGKSDEKDFLIVEGYTYVNAWVGDGVNLKRSAMVAASDDYMKWGAVREMHQPSAVGTAIGSVELDGETIPLGVTWDDHGALLRCKVVDEDAIRKVNEGVYRGFSVSVAPSVMRGNDVESCKWVENSLVDRPADPDAAITLFRADNAETDYQVVRYYDDYDIGVSSPATFNDMVPALEQADFYSDISSAWYVLMDSCRSLMADGQSCAESFDQFVAYLRPYFAGETERALTADICRAALEKRKPASEVNRAFDLQTEMVERDGRIATLTSRAESVEAELVIARAKVTDLTAKLDTIPDPTQVRPVLIANERDFVANRSQTEKDDDTEALKTELETLSRTLRNDPDQDVRRAGAVRISLLKSTLRERGIIA